MGRTSGDCFWRWFVLLVVDAQAQSAHDVVRAETVRGSGESAALFLSRRDRRRRQAAQRRSQWRPRYFARRALVRAALRAAAERAAEPLVRAAFRAEAERSAAVRREAARLACFDSAARETVLRGSRLRARATARETRGRRRVLRLCCPAA